MSWPVAIVTTVGIVCGSLVALVGIGAWLKSRR